MPTQTVKPPRPLHCLAAFVIGGLALVGLWLRNYNLLGNLYDYSIVTSACGHLQAGLYPYRDFTTPLQSLTIYSSYAAELVFGPRYLALAYGNLVLGLGFYAAIFWGFGKCLPLPLRLLTMFALCAATVFQHGILWYNSIAMVLLTLIVWRLAQWYREGHQSRRHPAILCLLLFLSSTTKLNFHILALGVTAGLLFLFAFKLPPTERKCFVWVVPAIILSGVVLGPAVEILLNRTTLHDFLENVVTTPHGRFLRLLGFLNPNLYLGKAADTYPDNWSGGVYLSAGLIYCGCVWLFFRQPAGSGPQPEQPGGKCSAKLFMLVVLLGFYSGAVMLSASNVETQMLTSAFLLTGLVATFVMFAPQMEDLQCAGFKLCIFLLAGFFAVAGGTSAFMHSRVRYGEPSWTDAMLKAFNQEKSLSALRNAVPFYQASDINPRLENYFHGVRFTEPEFHKLRQLFSVLDQNRLHEQGRHIYWGPGLEIMNRVYSNTPASRFPLWYDMNLTVRDRDSDRIIAALKENDFQWIITGGFIHAIPPGVHAFIRDNYDLYQSEENEGLVFFRKKTSAAAMPIPLAAEPVLTK